MICHNMVCVKCASNWVFFFSLANSQPHPAHLAQVITKLQQLVCNICSTGVHNQPPETFGLVGPVTTPCAQSHRINSSQHNGHLKNAQVFSVTLCTLIPRNLVRIRSFVCPYNCVQGCIYSVWHIYHISISWYISNVILVHVTAPWTPI